MEQSETRTTLSAEEFEKLKSGKTGCTGCFVIVIVLIVSLAALLYFLLSDGFRLLFNPVALLAPVAGIAIIALAYVIQRRDKLKTEHDLRVGQKRVVTAQVINQFTRSRENPNKNFAVTMTYIVNIGGKQYEVSEEDYYKYKEGMWVEVHTAPSSDTFFGIYDAQTKELLTEELA